MNFYLYTLPGPPPRTVAIDAVDEADAVQHVSAHYPGAVFRGVSGTVKVRAHYVVLTEAASASLRGLVTPPGERAEGG